jgi:DNA repair ATPase RecN
MPATINFGPGLNIIYGASNTGKSFVIDTVDFMLGGRGPLRDIPERVGYDRILLAIETIDHHEFTLARSTEGGAFTAYEGLFSDNLPEGEGRVLAEQHSERRDDNLSTFLLSKLGLTHRQIRRNKRGDLQSLSFRNIARLIIINEEEIIQQRSPLSDGNVVADTANIAVFKFMLTGVDDSALSAGHPQKQEQQTRSAQLDLLDEMIDDYRRQVKDIAGQPSELDEQDEKLNATMEAHGRQLAISEAEYREAADRRRAILKRLEEGRNRLTEIKSLLERFELLQDHYRSDIARLKGIEEAGSLFAALGEAVCPLCGAAPEHHRLGDDCDGNVDSIVAAASAEIAKIGLRQGELWETITTLRKEAGSLERRLPAVEGSVREVSAQIETIVAPNLRALRTTYSQLADKRGEVRQAIALRRTLTDLEDRKAALETVYEASSANVPGVELSTSTADKFALLVLEILKEWHFPDAQRVHFDPSARDLVVNGKSRISYGKGLRAVTQAAFTVSLLEYCRREDTPHPGFVMLDSPLLSYREPEGPADDLRGVDLNTHFYRYLDGFKANRQVVVVENTDPPDDVRTSTQAIVFTGVPGKGRFGLFPTEGRGGN